VYQKNRLSSSQWNAEIHPELSKFPNTPFHALAVIKKTALETTRMWANAQRDGRPAEYSWRSLFNAAKFGWRPLLECRAVTKPRCKTC